MATCTGSLLYSRREGDYLIYRCLVCGHEERRFDPINLPTPPAKKGPTEVLMDEANFWNTPQEAFSDPAYRDYINWTDPIDPLGRRKLSYDRWAGLKR